MINNFKPIKKIICIFLLIVCFLSVIYAEELKIIKTDTIQQVVDEKTKSSTYKFTQSADSLRIGDHDYFNIQPSTKINEAYIKTTSSGKITEAQFTVNQNGGVYVFGDDKITAPPNSKIIFKNGKIVIDAPINSKIDSSFYTNLYEGSTESKQVNIIELRGKDLQLAKGVILNEGVVTYQLGKPYVRGGTSAVINGFKIVSEPYSEDIELKFGSVGVFSWFNKEQGNYIRFDKEVTANGHGFKISFTPEGLINSEKAVTGKYTGYLNLPDKGNYGRGDKFTSGKDFENIKLIQEIVGVKSDGAYGPGTEEAVKRWQNRNGLAQTGKFGADELNKYLQEDNQGYIGISMKGARASIGNSANYLSIDVQGMSSINIGKETLSIDGKDISKKMISNLESQIKIPALINLRNTEGEKVGSIVYGSKSKEDYNKPTKSFTIGSKTYSLKVGEAYVVTAAQTAFTKAVAPSLNAEELNKLPLELRDNVAKAGHTAIMYVDNDGSLRVSESSWDGVKDLAFEKSLIYEMRDKVSGIYGFENADSNKIITGAKNDAEKKIGWFFTDVDSGIKTFGLNKAMKNDYSSYRSCVGHVCTLASYGGVNLKGNAEYLPLQNGDPASLKKYVESWGIKGDIKAIDSFNGYLSYIQKKAGVTNPTIIKDKSSSGIIAGALVKSISAIDEISYFKSKVGLSPSFTTPSQMIMGNLNEGIIKSIEPASQEAQNEMVAQKLQSRGYESNPSGILKWQKNYNARHSNNKIVEDGKWGTQCEKAYYMDSLYASNN